MGRRIDSLPSKVFLGIRTNDRERKRRYRKCGTPMSKFPSILTGPVGTFRIGIKRKIGKRIVNYNCPPLDFGVSSKVGERLHYFYSNTLKCIPTQNILSGF